MQRHISTLEGHDSQTSSSSWPHHRIQTAPAALSCEESRNILLQDLGEKVDEVDVEFFFKGLLPRLKTQSLLSSVEDSLIASGAIGIDSRGRPNRWKKYFPRAPSKQDAVEDNVFASLEALVKAIRDAAESPSDPTLHFVCRPTKSPESSTRDNPSRPDSYGILYGREKSTPAQWIDIAVPAEFKKDSGQKAENDNGKKILWSMYHIMREDPTRRFVYGFTIQDTKMRLWFVNRSDTFVSRNFNFIRNPRYVVHFFLSLLFATPDDLGWDDTITRVSPPDVTENIVYDIKVGETVYRTKRLISNLGAEAIHGRGTRVWEVIKLDSKGRETGERRVLKDFWADADRKPEGDILQRIRNSGTSKQREKIRRYFMAAEDQGEVYVGNQIDHTHVVMRKGMKPSRVTPLKIATNPSTRTASKLPVKGGFTLPRPVTGNSDIKYSAKVHYRVVFTEVGKTLQEVDSLLTVFDCLGDVVEGLKYFHQCGWVHRDISVGNVLLVGQEGKITDVEYAKRVSDNKTHGVRTGTPYFMAVEVAAGRYLWGALKLSAPGIELEEDLDRDEMRQQREANTERLRMAQASSSIAEPASHPTPFRQNSLHDMESVLWLAIWTLLCSKLLTPVGIDPAEWERYMEEHSAIAIELFRDARAQMSLLTSDLFFEEHVQRLHPILRPIARLLDACRRALMQHYREAEADLEALQESTNAAAGLHNKFAVNLENICILLNQRDIKIDVGEESDQSRAVRQARDRAAEELAEPLVDHPDPEDAHNDVEASEVSDTEDGTGDQGHFDEDNEEGSSDLRKKRKAKAELQESHNMTLRRRRIAGTAEF